MLGSYEHNKIKERSDVKQILTDRSERHPPNKKKDSGQLGLLSTRSKKSQKSKKKPTAAKIEVE